MTGLASPGVLGPSPGRLFARLADATARVGAAVAPWRDLAARLFLAKGFLIAEAMQLMLPATAPLASAPHSLLDAVAASDFGRVVQAAMPLLLVAGLFSRIAAVALLVQLTLLTGVAPGLAAEWLLLLGWVVLAGPGRVAVDTLLHPALRGSALPGAAVTGRLLATGTRLVVPWGLALLRLCIAAIVVAPFLPSAMQSGVAALAWLPAAPGTMSGLGAVPSLLVGICLVAGLGVRPLALGMLLLIPGGPAMLLDDRLFWALLLALPLLHGAGAASLDRRIAAWLARAYPRVRDLSPGALAGLPHVVIVGGGFGGIAAAQALQDQPCRVTLLDRRNFTLFQPLLYQVATAGLSPADIATPVRSMFRNRANVRVLLGEVTGVDAAGRTVLTAAGAIGYDFLVLATGARHAYFGRDDWAPDAPGLKQVEDAIEIRRRLLTAFEAAERAEDEAERQAWLTFVVVGGGPTGVELAGAIAELARQSAAGEFRAADPASARVILVQSDKRILPAFPPDLSARAETALLRLGVEVMTGGKVTEVDAGGVTVEAGRIAARTVLWAAGVMASPAGAWLGAPCDRAGRVQVTAGLSVPGHPEIFAIGDTAASEGWRGKPVPGLAPAAKQGGTYAARVIRARLLGRPDPAPFRYAHLGSLATIGRQSAVADFGFLRLHGAIAWWLWGAVHLAFLIGGRNRLTVLVEWLWAYLTFRRGTRLITQP